MFVFIISWFYEYLQKILINSHLVDFKKYLCLPFRFYIFVYFWAFFGGQAKNKYRNKKKWLFLDSMNISRKFYIIVTQMILENIYVNPSVFTIVYIFERFWMIFSGKKKGFFFNFFILIIFFCLYDEYLLR